MSPEQLAELEDPIEYPASDGEPMAETGIHVRLMILLITLLRLRYRDESNVYVIGNIFLYYQRGNPAACRCPDVMVIKGVPSTPERTSFFTWQEDAVPTVIFELTSNKTRDEDIGPKKTLYEELGVREYFLFDPLGDWLERPLMGYRLHRVADNGNSISLHDIEVHNEYAEILPASDGSLVSQELGLLLKPDGDNLLLFDLRTGEPLLAPEQLVDQVGELLKQLEEARLQIEEEHRLALKEKQRADEEKQRADKAVQRADDEKRRADEAVQQAEEQARRIAELERLLQSLRPSDPQQSPSQDQQSQ